MMRNRKIAFVAALAMLAAGCIQNGETASPKTRKELDAAIRQHVDCCLSMSERFLDSGEDAHIIGMAAASACQGSANDLVKAFYSHQEKTSNRRVYRNLLLKENDVLGEYNAMCASSALEYAVSKRSK